MTDEAKFEPVPPKNNRTPMLLIGAVVVVAIALLAAWALGFGPFAPAASPSAAPATATAAPTATATTAATATATATAEATPTTEPTASPSAEPSAEPTATATTAASASASPTASAVADVCARDTLTLKNPGRLTLSTDIPAFGPWWGGDAAEQYPNEPAERVGVERERLQRRALLAGGLRRRRRLRRRRSDGLRA